MRPAELPARARAPTSPSGASAKSSAATRVGYVHVTTDVIQPSEVSNWFRVGRGRSFQFDASDEEIARWLLAALPTGQGPYVVVGSSSVPVGHKHSWEPFTYPLLDIERCFAERDSPNLFVWSLSLTPGLHLEPGPNIQSTCAANGLILVQHRLPRMSPSIGLTHRVADEDSGKVLYHEAYDRMFQRLRRYIRSQLQKRDR